MSNNEFSLENIMNPAVSRVEKSMDSFVATIYGLGGLGKTPVATKMEKPLYLAFGKSGLSGINNIPVIPIKDWRSFKAFVRTFTNQKNYDELHTKYQTIILDEMEILYSYCEKFVANSEGVNKIKEGNGGYGLWGDLKTEWEAEILKVIGSGFTVIFILHATQDESGKWFPVGDAKRMLPILINHSELIGYVKGNDIDAETGKPVHSSLMLAPGASEYFARTRNEYFDPVIEDFTAENLVKAYYDAIDRQSKAENIAPVTKEERDAIFETEKRSFEDVMNEATIIGEKVVEKYGSKEKIIEIVENVMGKGALVSNATPKQQEAVEVIIDELKALL